MTTSVVEALRGAGLLDRQKPWLRVLDLGCSGEQQDAVYRPLVDEVLAVVYGVDARTQDSGSIDPNNIVCTVLGDGRPRKLFVTNTSTASSLYPPNVAFVQHFDGFGDALEVVQTIDVVTQRFEDTRLGNSCFDLIKSDLQGADLEILRASGGLLKRALAIEVEVEFIPQYVGQPKFCNTLSYLLEQGFEFLCFREIGSRPLVGYPFGQWRTAPGRRWLWGNALLCRSFLDWETLDADSLIRLAIILDVAFQIPDHAWRALSLVDGNLGTNVSAMMME